MNAQSRFKPIMHGMFGNKRLTDDVTDCRGKTRTLKAYTGFNKGKRYPYASIRQIVRQMRAHHAD